MKNKAWISNCCNASTVTNYGEEGTNHFRCSACGEPCDAHKEDPIVNEQTKRARAEVLSERIKLLFIFVLELKNDKDLLQEAIDAANDRASFASSAAALFGAVGMDYESAEFEAILHARRAKAILNLINTLEETEKDRAEQISKSKKKAEAQNMLRGILGM